MALSKITKAWIIIVPSISLRVLAILMKVITVPLIFIASVMDYCDQAMLNWFEEN